VLSSEGTMWTSNGENESRNRREQAMDDAERGCSYAENVDGECSLRGPIRWAGCGEFMQFSLLQMII